MMLEHIKQKIKHQPISWVLCLIISVVMLGFTPASYPSHQLRYFPNPIHTRLHPGTIWDRLTRHAVLQAPAHPRIRYYVQQFSTYQAGLQKIAKQATPYLFHILEQLEKRGLPSELAVLPMLESAYKPSAASNKGALGLWQLVASTAKRFGAKQDGWYDGRKDVIASTEAALNYLEYLHKLFHSDWMLVLAAYNSGEGTVLRAIKRNQKAGKPTNFWALKLPKQTQEYVPKFLAIVEVIKHARQYQVELPPINNQPHFVTVEMKQQIQLQRVAKLANIPLQQVRELNPAYHKWSTHPNGPHRIAVPVDRATIFLHNLAREQFSGNRLTPAMVPAAAPAQAKTKPVSRPNKVKAANNKVALVYRVRTGDNLSSIAKRLKISSKKLKQLNPALSARLKPGQFIKIG